MGDEDNRATFLMEALENLHDFFRRFRVEVACRLVRDDNMQIVDQRPRNRDTLPLAAGKLVRLMLGSVAESYRIKDFFRLFLAFPAPDAGINQRKRNIVRRADARKQIEILENKTDTPIPRDRQLVVGKCRNFLPVQFVRADRRSRQPRIFISVDFPEPEGPINAANSPFAILRSMPANAATSCPPT